MILLGNNIDELKKLDDNSIDSVVTDPPYGLKFMNKHWDHTVPSVELWTEILRVLKPGGHLLSFGGTRTYHRMAVNIEDAGFEIRDQLQWLYGSGFPKSHNVSKGIDKKYGAEREVVGKKSTYRKPQSPNGWDCTTRAEFETAPATTQARQWDGYGTALKPSNEPIVLARKPLSEKTIVDNVLKWGCGALNIDGCRIGLDKKVNLNAKQTTTKLSKKKFFDENTRPFEGQQTYNPQGRWPANTLLDESAAEMLDEQSGVSRSNGNLSNDKSGHQDKYVGGDLINKTSSSCYSDTGGASRFFYVAKASKRERNAGLEGMVDKAVHRYGAGIGEGKEPDAPAYDKNHHPTVKPIKLMQYLCRLITPPGGTVLDPFMGSGSTGIAAVNEGFAFVGIELDEQYFEIARGRIEHNINA